MEPRGVTNAQKERSWCVLEWPENTILKPGDNATRWAVSWFGDKMYGSPENHGSLYLADVG